MRLAGVEIRNFRSIFDEDIERPLRLELADGMNTLVGSNNGGKSNVLRAVSLALDPSHLFDLERDAPGPRPFALPTIRLRFVADRSGPEEDAILAAAAEYERELNPGGITYASGGEVHLQVNFQRTGVGVVRNEILLTPSARPITRREDQVRLDHALLRLREAVRFVLISSGESIESVLEGNFREILHSVVQERLSAEFAEADGARCDYIERLQESLLGPLRDRLTDEVGRLFPEVGGTQLIPDVPSIERTLSKVGIVLDDLVSTPLGDKGTGVRGGVLVAMLSYLAANATRSMVFAVEEPEAFLHPRAQEDLRDQLESIGQVSGISLLVTTHSSFVLPLSEKGHIFCIAKDGVGCTRVTQSVPGDAEHASLVGDLYREATFEDLLRRSMNLPGDAQAVLLVEGLGDELSLRLAARIVGRQDLLDGIHIIPAGGTIKIIARAVVTRAATEKPILVLVDNDDDGRRAVKELTGGHFNFNKKKSIASYAEVFPADQKHVQFPYEAEDLFAPELIEAFVHTQGTAVIDGSKKRPDGAFHYDFNQVAKEELGAFLDVNTRPEHVLLWIELILMLRQRFGLPAGGENAAEIVAAAPQGPPAFEYPAGKQVLVLPQSEQLARYHEQGFVVLPADQDVPADLTHIGFYVNAAIQPAVPRIEGLYQRLFFSGDTVEQLRATGHAADGRAADLIHRSIHIDDALAGRTHHLVLLSAADSADTLILDQPVENTTTRNGRPVAWAVESREVSYEALALSPKTTDVLDDGV